MDIINRILDILSDKGLKQADLCNYVGIKYNVFTTWKTRGTEPPTKFLIQICDFLGVSPYYLLTGEENNSSYELSEDEQALLRVFKQLPENHRIMVLERANTLFDLDKQQNRTTKIIPKIDMITMNISDVAAGAGVSTPFTIDNAFSPKEVPRNAVPSGADCGVPINGDSMEPNYPNGSIAWVKITQEIEPSDVVIAILNGEPYCKIYQPDGLHSFNEDYEIIHVNEQDTFSIFGKVIGYYEV